MFGQTFWLTFALLISLIVLQGFASHAGHLFWAHDMVRGRGFYNGLPFSWHLAMYGDIAVSFIGAYLMQRYEHLWFSQLYASTFLKFGLVGFAITVVTNVLWARDSRKMPGCHAVGGYLTLAGWLHAVYMIFTLPLILMYYLGTPLSEMEPGTTIGISAVLAGHVFCGMMHPILNLLRPSFWPHGGWKNWTGWLITLAAWVILGIKTYSIAKDRI